MAKILPKWPKFAIWTFFWKRLILETVTLRAKLTKIWDQKGHNMHVHHTLKIFKILPKLAILTFFRKQVCILETVTYRVKLKKIWDQKGHNMHEHHTLKIFKILPKCPKWAILTFSRKQLCISETVTDRAKWTKIGDH